MAEPKTQRTGASVAAFLDAIPDERRRADCWAIADLMKQATRAEPEMWGESIVGFGAYRYTYGSGRTADWPVLAFSPRKQNLTLYIMSGFDDAAALLAGLGPHTTGASCLYIKRMSDIHVPTLRRLLKASVAHMKALFPA